MKRLLVLCTLYITVQCNSRIRRDISELLFSNPGVQTRPIYRPPDTSQNGYDYPKPGIQTRPIYRDPEPTFIETRPIYQDQEPTWVQTRPVAPIYPVPDQGFVQTRPVAPIYPVPDQGFVQTRPIYRPQPSFPRSEQLFWPLINKFANAFNPNGVGSYPGSNNVGYPGGNYYPPYPNKFSFLSGLFPFNNNNNGYNGYQRLQGPPPPLPYVNTGIRGHNTLLQPGVSNIGDGISLNKPSIGEGYNYPNPNEQQPPFELPDGLQFRTQPKVEDDKNSS